MRKPVYKHWISKVVNEVRIVFDNPEIWIAEIESLNPSFRYYITVEKERERKTLSQLGYLWGAIYPECAKSEVFDGWKKEKIHEVLFSCLENRMEVIKNKNGEDRLITVVPDLSSYDKEQLSEYIDHLIMYLADEFGIVVQSPEDYKLNN